MSKLAAYDLSKPGIPFLGYLTAVGFAAHVTAKPRSKVPQW